jgi:hypothetical protein
MKAPRLRPNASTAVGLLSTWASELAQGPTIDDLQNFFTKSKIDGWDVILAVLVVVLAIVAARASRRATLGLFDESKAFPTTPPASSPTSSSTSCCWSASASRSTSSAPPCSRSPRDGRAGG